MRQPGVRGTYIAVVDAEAVTTAEDLMEITAGSHPVRIRSIVATQEAKDSSEVLPFQLYTASAAGSGGSAITPTNITAGGRTVSSTAAKSNTTQGTEDTIYDRRGVDMLLGYHFLPLPEEMPVFAGGTIICIGLMGAPDASMTISVTVIFDELSPTS